MDTEIINISKSKNKAEIYKKLQRYYKSDKLVAIPTETVYEKFMRQKVDLVIIP